MTAIKPDTRLGALRRFALAISILNILGHAFFGFEQAWVLPLASLATAYSMEFVLELLDSWQHARKPRFIGVGPRGIVDFLLSAHITGLAVAMLIYPNDQIWPVVFGTTVAVGSKAIFRVRVGPGMRHFFNPSNLGIAATILIFPWVGAAAPYHFTENLNAAGQWIIPAIIFVSGSFLNLRFANRFWVSVGWLGGFVVQALLRSAFFHTPLVAALLPMTGVPYLLYTFYMVTDPGTTPSMPRAQVAFGVAVAAMYGMLVTLHVGYALFYALTPICLVRGLSLYMAYPSVQQWVVAPLRSRVAVPISALLGVKS